MSIFDSLKKLFGVGSTHGSAKGAGAEDDGTPEGMEMIPCEEALRLVHEFLDGELEGVPEEQVERHFAVCQRCYPHLKLERAYRDTVRRAAAGEGAPPALKDRVAELLVEARTDD